MATDYDAPRRGEEQEPQTSMEELTTEVPTKNTPPLPSGADLAGEELTVRVLPMKPISPAAHGAIDYGLSIALLTAPKLLGMRDRACAVFGAIGLSQGTVNALTAQPLTVKPVIPFKTRGVEFVKLSYWRPSSAACSSSSSEMTRTSGSAVSEPAGTRSWSMYGVGLPRR